MRLSNPAPGRYITSAWGTRKHPITGILRLHAGIDFGGSFPVLAAAAGKVVENRWHWSFGWYVVIEHAPGLRTQYMHGAAQSKLKVGTRVAEGQHVYTAGTTGTSTGNHLHFGVLVLVRGAWVNVNPAPYLEAPPFKPTPAPKRRRNKMEPYVITRVDGGAITEMSVCHPTYVGTTPIEQGYYVVRAGTNPDGTKITVKDAMVAAARAHGLGFGISTTNGGDRDEYVAGQKLARQARIQYLRDRRETTKAIADGIPAGSITPGTPVDTADIADAVAAELGNRLTAG